MVSWASLAKLPSTQSFDPSHPIRNQAYGETCAPLRPDRSFWPAISATREVASTIPRKTNKQTINQSNKQKPLVIWYSEK